METILQEIKKQNNIPSDDDLKAALAREGIEFAAWKEMWKDRRKQERLVAEEVGSKIKIDNPQIMEYYRANAARFTLKAEFTLNCIYLKANEDGTRPQEKMDLVWAELKPGNFAEVAKKHSELPGAAESIALGKFKQGELDKNLEAAALKLKKDEYSGWIETENGWYVIQLAEFSPERLQEVKDVREEIIQTLREARAAGQAQGLHRAAEKRELHKNTEGIPVSLQAGTRAAACGAADRLRRLTSGCRRRRSFSSSGR